VATIIQQDAWSNNSSNAPWTQNLVFADGNPGQRNVTAGSAILVFWAGPSGNTLSSITDNYGNSYSKIAGASKTDAGLGYDGEWWIATNVAAVTYPVVGPRLALTFTYAGSASNQVGFWALEISGVNSATQVTGTESINQIGNGANFSGDSLNGGSVGAIYLMGFSGVAEDKITVGSPWSIKSVLQETLAPTAAILASAGAQQPTCTPSQINGFAGVVCGLAFTGVDVSINPQVPAYLDQGHVFDGVLYTGTLLGWGGRTGYIVPDLGLGDTALPTVHTGEEQRARAHIDDFTFTPSSLQNGQRVTFYMVRDSDGDKLAKSIATLS
jgi:hypothetical protein